MVIIGRIAEISMEFAEKEAANKRLMAAERHAVRKLDKMWRWKKPPKQKPSSPPSKNTSTKKERKPRRQQ
jgi:hypothetical protein